MRYVLPVTLYDIIVGLPAITDNLYIPFIFYIILFELIDTWDNCLPNLFIFAIFGIVLISQHA